MARKSGIWWHKSRKCWYTSHGGKNQRLDPIKKTAEQMWAKLVGKPTAKGDELLVKQVLDEYLDWSEANHAASTHKRVRASNLSFAESLPATLTIGDLEPRHLTQWLDARYPKRPKEGEKAASENTRHDIASDVLAAFNWACSANQRRLRYSPLAGYRKPPKTPRVLYLAPEQMDDLLSRIDDQEFRDFLIVTLRTGCRPQEVRMLEAKYVLLKEGEARIPKELAKGKRKERRVPLDNVVQAILKPLVLKYPEGPLLRNTKGRPWTKDAINSRFQRLKEKLPYRATAYAMRHTFINEALKNGASETAIAEVVGHEDKTMIQKVYGHPSLHQDLLKGVVTKANRRAAGGKAG
ncbi:MAG: site-specific integrase [Isosphaeraceae bacterium]|jgi:integrase